MDTAATVTIISDSIFREVEPNCSIISENLKMNHNDHGISPSLQDAMDTYLRPGHQHQ